MNTIGKQGMVRTLLFASCIAFSASAATHGGWHGGGGGWHGGGWHGGGWHGGGWHGGGWGNNRGWYGAGLGVGLILGAPLLYNTYYNCPTVRVCNYDQCWLQRSCSYY